MIGISKHDKKIVLKPKKVRQLEDNQRHESNENFLLCSCGLPMGKSNYFIRELDDGEHTLLCQLCIYPEKLDVIASTNMGEMIFAPDLTQQQVNAIAIFNAFVLEYDDPDLDELCDDINAIIKKRRDFLESIYGEGSSDPELFCQFLYLLSDAEYANRGEFVKHMRYLPSTSIIKEDLDFYKTNILKNFTPNKWRGMLQTLNNEAKSKKTA